METCNGPNWAGLPEDSKELILSKLHWIGLAWVSTTSRDFQALFLRALARKQKACSDSGVELLGRERIATLVALIGRVLKTEGVKAHVHSWGELGLGYCILRYGTCHTENPLLSEPANQTTHVVETRVCNRVSEEIGRSLHVQVENGLCVSLWSPLWSPLRPKEVGGLIKSSLFSTAKGLPVVQALLSEGLAQVLHDAGHQVVIEIIRGQRDLTFETFKSMVAPLMPLITHRTFKQGEVVGVLK